MPFDLTEKSFSDLNREEIVEYCRRRCGPPAEIAEGQCGPPVEIPEGQEDQTQRDPATPREICVIVDVAGHGYRVIQATSILLPLYASIVAVDVGESRFRRIMGRLKEQVKIGTTDIEELVALLKELQLAITPVRSFVDELTPDCPEPSPVHTCAKDLAKLDQRAAKCQTHLPTLVNRLVLDISGKLDPIDKVRSSLGLVVRSLGEWLKTALLVTENARSEFFTAKMPPGAGDFELRVDERLTAAAKASQLHPCMMVSRAEGEGG